VSQFGRAVRTSCVMHRASCTNARRTVSGQQSRSQSLTIAKGFCVLDSIGTSQEDGAELNIRPIAPSSLRGIEPSVVWFPTRVPSVATRV